MLANNVIMPHCINYNDKVLFVHRFFDPGSVVLGENNPVITNESTVTNLSSASQRIEGNFVIDNAGPSTIPNARLTIFWPYYAPGNDRFYLYPYQIDGVG